MPDPKDKLDATAESDPNGKPTIAVDTLVVLNRLFDGLREDVRRTGEESRAAREESRASGEETKAALTQLVESVGELKKSDKTLADEVHRQSIILATATADIATLKEWRSQDTREIVRAHARVSESDEQRKREMTAWQTHSRQLEGAIGQLSANDGKLLENDARQDSELKAQTTTLDKHTKVLTDQNVTLTEQTELLTEIKTSAGVIVRIAKSPRIAAYVAIGAVVGGAIMAIAEKVFH